MRASSEVKHLKTGSHLFTIILGKRDKKCTVFLILNKNPGFSLWNSPRETGTQQSIWRFHPRSWITVNYLFCILKGCSSFLISQMCKAPNRTVRSNIYQGLTFFIELSKRHLPPLQTVLWYWIPRFWAYLSWSQTITVTGSNIHCLHNMRVFSLSTALYWRSL